MDPQELDTYKYQLSQVEQALQGDPSNEELKGLQESLQSLISLSEEAIRATSGAGSSAAHGTSTPNAPSSSATNTVVDPAAHKAKKSGSTTPAPSTPIVLHKKIYATGEECQARFSVDRKFYNAVIVASGGPGSTTDNPVYTVRYVDYGNTELVAASDLRPVNASDKKRAAHHQDTSEAEKERSRQKARYAKKEEKRAEKEAAQLDKRKAWSSFAKKGAKKGFKGMGGDSMFKTPDNPHAKVGVVGSGRGMTNYQTMGKHHFDTDSASNSK